MLKVVQTESRSPLETLWREFPQLKNATVVGRMSCASRDYGCSVTRTFRTIGGQYLRIMSTQGGDEIEPIPAEVIEIYEEAWKRLGSRALGEPTDQPHGIMFASDRFFEEAEDLMEWVDFAD